MFIKKERLCLTMNETQLVVTMYKNGIAIKKISDVTGLDQREVYEILFENGYSHLKSRFEERDAEICRLYAEHVPIKEIAKQTKTDRGTVRKVLLKEGIHEGNRGRYIDCPENKERNRKIIELYQQGLSFRAVGKEVGVCPGTVSKVLSFFNIDHRPQHMKGHSKGKTRNRKHFFNVDFFESIDSEEKAYWLGFLYADGYVAYRGVVQIALKQDDVEHLKKFRTAMGDETVLITPCKKTKSHGMFFSSVKLAEDLTKLGCMQRKSLKLEFPTELQVPERYLNHFMRGYFDGDGCMYVSDDLKDYTFSVLGTPEFLEGYDRVLLEHMTRNEAHPHTSRDDWNEQTEESYFCAIKDIEEIYSFLYKDATIYLERKKSKFEKILSKVS